MSSMTSLFRTISVCHQRWRARENFLRRYNVLVPIKSGVHETMICLQKWLQKDKTKITKRKQIWMILNFKHGHSRSPFDFNLLLLQIINITYYFAIHESVLPVFKLISPTRPQSLTHSFSLDIHSHLIFECGEL